MDAQKTLLGAVVLAVIALIGDVSLRLIDRSTGRSEAEIGNRPELSAQQQSRITELEERIYPLQEANFELRLQKAELERALNGGIDPIEEGGLFAFIADYDFPAWCKRVYEHPEAPPTFVMRALNAGYERRYTIDKDKYLGGTDFENHPEEVAKQYYANDLDVFTSRDSDTFLEAGQGADGLYKSKEYFHKLYISLPVSERQYICGFMAPPLDGVE